MWYPTRPLSSAPLLAAALVLGCAANPLTQKRDLVFVSTQQEVERGGEAARAIADEMGLVQDPERVALVAEVGARVVSATPAQGYAYRFELLDLVEPNAFALPGGHVYVSRGLLALTNDEHELANVLAHEIVHVAARHHAQRHARAAGVGLLALPGMVLGGLVGGPVGSLVSAPFALAGVGAIASYSRSQELEADEYAQQLAGRAGYDPGALARFLASLEREQALAPEGLRDPGWLDSHPTTPSRVQAARNRARMLPAAAASDGERVAYLRRLDGLLVGDDPAGGVFDGQRFLHPDLDFTLVLPEGWRTQNGRRAVGGVDPEERAQLVVEIQGDGDDPREAASAFLDELRGDTRVDVVSMRRLALADREAVRGRLLVEARSGRVALDVTWLEHGGSIFRLAGVVTRGYGAEDERRFEAVARSFARLSPAQRSGIVATRLRLRQARAGETLAEFSLRTGNAWTPAQTAVANALEEDESLAGGRWLKVSLPEPHRPARRESGGATGSGG